MLQKLKTSELQDTPKSRFAGYPQSRLARDFKTLSCRIPQNRNLPKTTKSRPARDLLIQTCRSPRNLELPEAPESSLAADPQIQIRQRPPDPALAEPPKFRNAGDLKIQICQRSQSPRDPELPETLSKTCQRPQGPELPETPTPRYARELNTQSYQRHEDPDLQKTSGYNVARTPQTPHCEHPLAKLESKCWPPFPHYTKLSGCAVGLLLTLCFRPFSTLFWGRGGGR